MPAMNSTPQWVSDPDMHHVTRVTHVPWCMPGSLTRGLFWNQWRGKRSRISRRVHKPQFYVSDKRSMLMESVHMEHMELHDKEPHIMFWWYHLCYYMWDLFWDWQVYIHEFCHLLYHFTNGLRGDLKLAIIGLWLLGPFHIYYLRQSANRPTRHFRIIQSYPRKQYVS